MKIEQPTLKKHKAFSSRWKPIHCGRERKQKSEPKSPAVLVTAVGVLVQVPVMLSVCKVCNESRPWYQRALGAWYVKRDRWKAAETR